MEDEHEAEIAALAEPLRGYVMGLKAEVARLTARNEELEEERVGGVVRYRVARPTLALRVARATANPTFVASVTL